MKSDNLNTKNDDFFDYLSEIEMHAVSDEDVTDIHNRIDKKVQSGSVKGNTNGISVALILGFTTLLLFILFNKNQVLQIGKDPSAAQEKSGDILVTALKNDTVQPLTSKPELIAEVKEKSPKKEHFVKESRDTHFAEETKSDLLPNREISLIDTSTSSQLSENFLQLLPNASVIYIYDLKITEFQKLYFKKMKPFVLEVRGLSAEFENSDAYQSYINDKKSTNEYTLDMLLKDALKLFNKKKFKQALILFDELLNYNTKDVNALFYSALCQYNTGEYSDAVSRLNKVLESENNVFGQEAEWYKAQCQLKNGDEKEAVTLLLKINNQKGFYALSAGEKLKEISLRSK